MSWIEKILPAKIRTEETKKDKKNSVPEGLWNKCPECNSTIYQPELKKTLFVCPKCNHHLRIGARARLNIFLDNDEYYEIGANVKPVDPLKFKDTKSYKDRLTTARKKTGETEALIVVKGMVKAMPMIVGVFDFNFLGGSMGSVVGERFVLAVNAAIENKLPFVCFTASGGARMQESLFSLMQMAKVSAALAKLRDANLPYIVVLTDPTTGGVSASLAMLGDINIAEPNALIGFAGPRVIEQTVREKLPEGFQRSEFLLEKGMIDIILDRKELRDRIPALLAKLMKI